MGTSDERCRDGKKWMGDEGWIGVASDEVLVTYHSDVVVVANDSMVDAIRMVISVTRCDSVPVKYKGRWDAWRCSGCGGVVALL